MNILQKEPKVRLEVILKLIPDQCKLNFILTNDDNN